RSLKTAPLGVEAEERFLCLGVEGVGGDHEAEPRSRLVVAVKRVASEAEVAHEVKVCFGPLGMTALEQCIEPGEIGRGFLEVLRLLRVSAQPVSNAQAVQRLRIVGVGGICNLEVAQGSGYVAACECLATAQSRQCGIVCGPELKQPVGFLAIFEIE